MGVARWVVEGLGCDDVWGFERRRVGPSVRNWPVPAVKEAIVVVG